MEESGRGDENIPAYQAEKLDRFGGNTLLTELMSIPKPKVHRWGYGELIPQFTTREEYYQVVKPRRIKFLRGLIKEHKPDIIIGYGKAFWNDYRKLFEGIEFKQEDRFQTAVLDDMSVILTDHFTAQTMNGRFDEVVEIIRKQVQF